MTGSQTGFALFMVHHRYSAEGGGAVWAVSCQRERFHVETGVFSKLNGILDDAGQFGLIFRLPFRDNWFLESVRKRR